MGINTGVSSAVKSAKPVCPAALVPEVIWQNAPAREVNGANQSLKNNFHERVKRLGKAAAGRVTLPSSSDR